MQRCPSCGQENPDGVSYCAICGTSLTAAPAAAGEASGRRAIRGRVLAYDWRSGSGVISGAGRRYEFSAQEWRSDSPPRVSSTVEFVPDGERADDIYLVYSGGMPFGQTESKRLAAGILALLLGALGIHKFYLGYAGEGVILLLMSTVGLILVLPAIAAAVIGIVEGVIYLTKTDEEFDAMYVTGRRSWF